MCVVIVDQLKIIVFEKHSLSHDAGAVVPRPEFSELVAWWGTYTAGLQKEMCGKCRWSGLPLPCNPPISRFTAFRQSWCTLILSSVGLSYRTIVVVLQLLDLLAELNGIWHLLRVDCYCLIRNSKNVPETIHLSRNFEKGWEGAQWLTTKTNDILGSIP